MSQLRPINGGTLLPSLQWCCNLYVAAVVYAHFVVSNCKTNVLLVETDIAKINFATSVQVHIVSVEIKGIACVGQVTASPRHCNYKIFAAECVCMCWEVNSTLGLHMV